MLKLVGFALIALVGIVLIGGIAVQLFFGGYAKEVAVKAINERLDAPLTVKEISFSVFRHFPYASVDLNNVELKEGIKGSTKPLLVAEKISAQFNVLSLLSGDYSVKRVRIENGKLMIAMDKTDHGNYFVFKKSASTSTGNAAVSIEKIILVNVEVEHSDLYNNQSYALLIKEAEATGEFSATKFSTNVDANLYVRNALVDNVSYLKEKPATLALDLFIDLDQELYKFNKCKLAVSEATFNVNGLVARTKNGYDLNLALNGEDIGLEELGSLLPEDYYKYIRGYSTEGDLKCDGTIKGTLSKKTSPAVEFNFGIKDGTIEQDGESIDDVNLSATYTNGKTQHGWKHSTLLVPKGSVVFNGIPFVFSLELSRFDNPFIALNLNGTVDLASIKPLLGINEDDELTGTLQLVNFEYRGAAGKINSKNAVAAQSSGTLVFKDVYYESGDAEIKSFNATLVSDGNNLNIHNCSAAIGNSDLSVSGNVSNAIPALVAGFTDNKLDANLTVVSENIDVNDFKFGNAASDSTSIYKTPWWKNISGKALCNVTNFKSDKFKASDVQMRLVADNGLVRFNGLQLSALGGSVLADGTFDLHENELMILETTFACKDVDVNRMFVEFDNFSQDGITADNLEGMLATRCYMKATWRNGEFQTNALVAMADVSIDKGELKKYEPMYALSKFAKVDDLENIRFSRLSNQIEIRNGVINIPNTTIRSSVATIELSGTHSLENIIDYKLKLNLNQLVSNKFKRVSTFDPEAMETSDNGMFNLYVRMKGPAGNPTITYDKTTVKVAVQQSVQQEGKTLKETLKQEFSRQENKEYKQQQVREWEAPEEYELLDLDANADTDAN